jgi:hypothetical protein
MSEPSFTPAPWVQGTGNESHLIFKRRDDGGRTLLVNNDGNSESIAWVSCDVRHPPSKEERLANARLIAAAPELLAALDHLIESRCDLCKAHVSIETCKECWMIEYKQLLARAKGEHERTD